MSTLGEKTLPSDTNIHHSLDTIPNPTIKAYDSEGNEILPFPDDRTLEDRYSNETDINVLRERCQILEKENQHLKENAIKNFCQMEAEEEGITNRVIKKLDEVKKEKERLAIEIEREEEMLTNSLQRKLRQVLQEKIDIENQLEQEQENIMNRYVRVVEKTNSEKKQLEEKLNILCDKVDAKLLEEFGVFNDEKEKSNKGTSFRSSPSASEKEKILFQMGNEPDNVLKRKLNSFLADENITSEKKTEVMIEIYNLMERGK